MNNAMYLCIPPKEEWIELGWNTKQFRELYSKLYNNNEE